MTAVQGRHLLTVVGGLPLLRLLLGTSRPAHAVTYTVATTEDGRQFGSVTDGVCPG